MCWSNSIAIPIVLKKPLKVYKVGTATILNGFISLFQNFIYLESQTMPTVEINPKFVRIYPPLVIYNTIWDYDNFYIFKGYHSYLTKEGARCNSAEYDDIGIFEIPAGATIYVNFRHKEIVSTDIKYLGLLK